MPPRNPVTDTERQRILQLHAQGKSRNEIRKLVGRSSQVVSDTVKNAGLSFDRSKTAAATQAKTADNAAKRAQLESDLLDDAQRLRTQLWTPCRWGNFGGKENTYNYVDLDQPTFEQQRAITNSVGNVVDRAIKLAGVGKSDNDEEARSLVRDLGKAMGVQGL